MKRKLTPALLFISLVYLQCSKNKSDNKGPDLNKGLFAWFKLDNDLIDYTGNDPAPSHAGTINPVYDRKGNADNAMFFDNGLVIFKTDSILADQLSVSFWMKPKSLQGQCFITVSKEYAFGIQQYNNKLYYHIYTGSLQPELVGTIKSGWTHVVATTDGKDMKLYLNGVLADTKPHPGKTYGTNSIYVGNFNGIFWPGTLDDLRYYNRALTEEEITQLANE